MNTFSAMVGRDRRARRCFLRSARRRRARRSRPTHRLPTVGAALGVCLLGLAILAAEAQEIRPPDDYLIVHEWGTFTTVAGEDGVALDWRPLAGTNDLPQFVYNITGLTNGAGLRGVNCPKCDITARVRMETPVIYFYTARETNISVKVDFPKGLITEWYPKAREVSGGINWGRIGVFPGRQPLLRTDDSGSHYYAARDTDAALVRACDDGGHEYEKFLFYRGVGSFDLPLAVTFDNNELRLKNLAKDEIERVIVFENRGGEVSYGVYAGLRDDIVLPRPIRTGQRLDSLMDAFELVLLSQGLYEKEAQAMIATWRDSWFEEGLRVFYTVPRNVTDSILPLTVDPPPSESVRVLVGRVEIITPEVENAVGLQVNQLDNPSQQVREAARAALRKHGRFAEPILKRILAQTDNSALRERIEQLIKPSS